MQEFFIDIKKGHKLVHGKYIAGSCIGQGSFSSVFSIKLDNESRDIVRAIKLQHQKAPIQQISNEVSLLKSIQGTANSELGFTRLFEFGYQQDYNYMVMEIVGPNLQQLLKLSGEKLSLKTVLILALQMIDRMQVLHNSGFVYKDMKPQNFLIGLENKSHILYLIDFGKSCRFKNKQTKKHLPYSQNIKFDGEYLYSSLNTHNGIEYSRRDDLEAIIYLMIYLRKGKLPWSAQSQFKTKKEKDAYIQQIKKRTPVQHLTYKMPLSINDILYYVRTLNYYEKPDYDFIRMCLHRAFVDVQQNWKMVFDWNLIDHMDYTLYNGEPKIVLKIDQSNQQMLLGNQNKKQEKKIVQNEELI